MDSPAESAAGRPDVPRSRDLHAIVGDGIFFGAMVGLGETYVPAFALAAGLGEVVAGLAATLPMLAGALFQLLTPWAVRRLRSYRRWIVACACLQALSFTPLIIGAAQGRIGTGWLGVATVAYWSFGMATSPAWSAWVTSLVPAEIRARFFASRSRYAQAALFSAILAGGLLLQWGRERGEALALFALLFAAAMLARLVSAGFLARQSEARGLAEAHRALSPRATLLAVREAHSGRVLAYLLVMQAAVNVAAPFFTPYMLGPLSLSYDRFMLLTAAAFLARIAVLPALGRLAHRRGTRLVLWCGAIGIVPLPLLWLVSHHYAYLLLLQMVAGTAWAALEFATLLSFFEGIEDRHRASVLSVFNLVNAAAVALGAAVGSRIFLGLDAGAGAAYAWLFATSSLCRLLALLVLRGSVAARSVVALPLRTLAVRPSAGAVQRPVLTGLSSDASEASSAARAGGAPE